MSSAQVVLKTLSDVVRAYQDERRKSRAGARDLEFERVLSRMRRHRQRRARRLTLLLTVCTIASVAVWGHTQFVPQGQRAGAEAARWAWIESGSEGTPVMFDDGSGLQLDAGARARLGYGPGLAAHLMLEAGGVTGRLQRSDSGPWRLDAGPFTVVAKEAEFTLRWDVERGALRIAVTSGGLELRRASGAPPQVLGPGARLEVAY